MSYNRLMAWNSFALVNNTMWIGIPKVATTSLYTLFQDHSITYYNDNKEFLDNQENKNPKQLWCIWRDPWERWLSAVIQDYEYKFDLGIVAHGKKTHRRLTNNELEILYKDLNEKWKFNHTNLRNKSFQHSGIYVARYITLLWKLINMRFNCPEIEFYHTTNINIAIKNILNANSNPLYLNQSNSDNTAQLGILLKEKKFYNKWKMQYQEDINLNNIIKKYAKLNINKWNDTVLYINKSRYKSLKLPPKFT